MDAGNLVVWLLLLVFVSWFVASLCFVPYLIVSVLSACIKDLEQLAEYLMKGITFPYRCARNMMHS